MNRLAKFYTATCVFGVATLFALAGFSRLQGEVLGGHVNKSTVLMLFGGVIVGITAGVTRLYLGSRLDSPNAAQKIAVETLAALGKRSKKN